MKIVPASPSKFSLLLFQYHTVFKRHLSQYNLHRNLNLVQLTVSMQYRHVIVNSSVCIFHKEMTNCEKTHEKKTITFQKTLKVIFHR